MTHHRTRTRSGTVVAALCLCTTLSAQTPQPPPAGAPVSPRRQAPVTAPASPVAAPAVPATAGQPLTAGTSKAEAAPTDAQLGLPVFPTAVFLRSYDAGRGQRYYLYGARTTFAEMVTYYRNVLKEKGNLVFEIPPTHTFEVGKFREETMAFPPGVTVKDYTFSGSAGYPNPFPGQQPERFPTVIQIVPLPAGASPR